MIAPFRRSITPVLTLLTKSPEPLRRQCPTVNMGYLTKAFTTYGYDDLSLADLLKQVRQEVVENTGRLHEQNKV